MSYGEIIGFGCVMWAVLVRLSNRTAKYCVNNVTVIMFDRNFQLSFDLFSLFM